MEHTDIFVAADNILSPLGFDTKTNFEKLLNMESGIREINDPTLSPTPVFAGKIDDEQIATAFRELDDSNTYSRFEQLCILSVHKALQQVPDINIRSARTLLVLSSTKGNIDLLNRDHPQHNADHGINLWKSGQKISSFFGKEEKAVIVSNACISGVLAMIVAKRMIVSGAYDVAVVCGADLLTEFVVSGFQSFKAISDQIAKPYDIDRNGISLGEGAATIVLTSKQEVLDPEKAKIIVTGAASSNDANHISGPSRTGDGLLLAIEKTLKRAGKKATEIEFISGHGTATLFNDEMEALAVHGAGLQHVPMNSLKSYFGHTLGAAGLIESVIGIESMRSGQLIGTLNYKESGVSQAVNILATTSRQPISNCLKTAAGFGGCNAAILFEKI